MEFKMSNKVYDILKWVAMCVFPAFITLIGLIGHTLNFAQTDVILTILGGIQVFVCTVLGISTNNYKIRMNESLEIETE